jgi:PAS domain S-box-containing protein
MSTGAAPSPQRPDPDPGETGDAREQALRESEARYRKLFEEVPVGLYRSAKDGRILDANPALISLLGYPDLETLRGVNSAATYVEPDARARWQALVERDGVVRDFDTPLYRMDGSVIWTRHTARGVRDAEGRIVEYEGAIEDITEQRRTLEALRVIEERFRQLAENVREVFWMFDARLTRTIYVSPAFEQIYGRPVETLYGDASWFLSATHPEDLPTVVAAMRRAREGSEEQVEFRVVRPDGSVRWVSARGFPVRDAAGEIYRVVGTSEDVTERRELEEQFRQAQKMEAVGRLAGGVAHDFNNLLTIIKGHAALMATEPPGTAWDRDSLEEIQRAASRAAELTNQLLAFSRKQMLRPRVLDLNAAVAGVQRILSRVIGEDVELVIDLEPELWPTLADPGQIEQVLLNLAVNARDAMPDGGVLRIETRNLRLGGGGGAAGPALPPGDYVRLEVGDTGSGMEPEVRSRIFEPFFTTKDVGQGTGLGLAMVHGVVEQSGGHIAVESQPGLGARFVVHLARHREPAASAADAPATPRSGGTETILLVEDEDAVRLIAARALRQAGYTVLEAADGEQALGHVAALEGPLHLLLTDAVMPHMPGSALAERVASLRPATRVLFMSGYTQDAALRSAVGRTGVGFLPKPFAPMELLAAVRRMLDG